MKKIVLALLILVSLNGCRDIRELDKGVVDNYTNNGAPVITAVYYVGDTLTALTSVRPKSFIRIEGRNLASATRINIGGIEIPLRTHAFTEAQYAVVQIPDIIPVHTTSELLYVTAEGTMHYPLTLSIPALQLYGLMNEFVFAGSEVRLNGKYFETYGFGDSTRVRMILRHADSGYEQRIYADSCLGDYCAIHIPRDCPDNSRLFVIWQSTKGEQTRILPFRPNEHLLLGNFDLTDGGNKDYVTDGSHSGDPGWLGYKYWRYCRQQSQWNWFDTHWRFRWQEADATAHPENYYLCFEVLTEAKHPFYRQTDDSGNPIGGGYMFNLADCGNVQFDPVGMGVQNTAGKWVTIRMPLRDLVAGKSLPTVGTSVEINFICQSNTGDWDCDHSFGQFRIEPILYND